MAGGVLPGQRDVHGGRARVLQAGKVQGRAWAVWEDGGDGQPAKRGELHRVG